MTEVKTCFGFAVSDSMFEGDLIVTRENLELDEVKDILSKDGTKLCLNPFHISTINAMNNRFGIHVEIPEKPANISLGKVDSLVVMQVRGLPRLPQDRKEYTQEEIDSAGFTFSRWTVRGTVIDLHIQMDVGVNRDFDECGFGMDNIHKNTDAFFS